MRARGGLIGLLLLGLAACGGTPKSTVDVTFFTSATVSPASPVAAQNYAVSFNLENADEQHSTLRNVQWTVARNGTANAYSGVIPALVSHQPVPIALTDHQVPGTYTYTVVLDPNNQILEINKSNNTATIVVTVVPLTVE